MEELPGVGKQSQAPVRAAYIALQILFIISLLLLSWAATFCLLCTVLFGPAQAAGECPRSSSGAGGGIPAPFLNTTG